LTDGGRPSAAPARPGPSRWSLWPTLLVLALTGVLPLPGLAQSDEEKARGELRELEAEMKRITSAITDDTNRQSKLQAQLRDTEKDLGALQREIREKQRALDKGREELAALEQQRTAQEEARDRQQARIALEVKTAWKLGRQGQLKLLLNQESPHTVARSMAYYRYFFEARNVLLEQYRQTLRELEDLQQRIETTIAELDARRQSLEQQQAELTAAQDQRRQLVARLADSISDKSAQLKQKEQDRKRLEDLLRAIQEAVVDIAAPRDYKAFTSARGGMPWPVPGKPSNQFDRPRNDGKMRWQGLTIPAAQGTLVRAIHQGRVVYADWLRGSGLLLIIDHGDGYMSLYAHNESLLRDVGEWVSAGDPVSTVGNSGGVEEYALYFEIRHKGKPVNPSQWCGG